MSWKNERVPPPSGSTKLPRSALVLHARLTKIVSLSEELAEEDAKIRRELMKMIGNHRRGLLPKKLGSYVLYGQLSTAMGGRMSYHVKFSARNK